MIPLNVIGNMAHQAKFKVGQRVRISDRSGFSRGSQGVITNINRVADDFPVSVRRDGAGSSLGFRFSELELLPVAEQQAGHTGGPVSPIDKPYIVGEKPSGFVANLSPKQRAAALAYSGPENHGDPAFARRRGSFMQTHSGRQFWPMDARANDVHIEDIAHALSMQCRYAGHTLRFYSVAEHCVHIGRWLMQHYPHAALAGLLHDATEAFLVDMPRPVKASFPDYRAAERRLWCVIAERFGLDAGLPDEVHEADTRILADEVRQNMRPMDWHTRHDDPLCVTLQFWSPEVAKREFLALFAELTASEPQPWSAEDQADLDYQVRKEAA